MKKITIYYPEDAPKPDLKLLQAAVGGGLIEPVDRFIQNGIDDAATPETPVRVAYVNEEGRLRGMSRNPEGARAVNWPTAAAGDLVGPVVVCEGWTRADHTGE